MNMRMKLQETKVPEGTLQSALQYILLSLHKRMTDFIFSIGVMCISN